VPSIVGWWKHLKSSKRVFWKIQQKADKYELRNADRASS
jgi:hypothetical protein